MRADEYVRLQAACVAMARQSQTLVLLKPISSTRSTIIGW
jgi:hypothetical protein